MKKRTFIKHLTAFSLCVAMVSSTLVTMPAKSIYAKERQFCYIALSSEHPPENFPEDGYLYFFGRGYGEDQADKELNQPYDGASYDVSTNTLTLNNFNHPDMMLTLDGMGTTQYDTNLQIVLVGNNSIQSIWSGHE